MFEQSSNRLAEIALNTFKELKPEYQEYVLNQMDQLLKLQDKENGS